MRARSLKVGEVARRTGLTVRTLHHYDEIGLLKPSEQTSTGHRLYTEEDISRLQQIASMRQLGFSLQEVSELLRPSGTSLLQVVELHLQAVQDQIAKAQELRHQLEAMASRLRSGKQPTLDELLHSIKETVMYENYFTQEQINQLKARGSQLGPDAQRKAEKAWKQLAMEVRAEFDRGTPPTAPAMQELARRWRGLTDDITGGDDGIRQGLVALHRAQPEVAAGFFGPVVDDAVLKYIGQAVAALPRN
jgi:MerR family transcriptional regulator, thiopeptide resistance regulator